MSKKKKKVRVMKLYWQIEKCLDQSLENALDKLELITNKKLKKEECE